jgi:hypothetical protein
MWTIEQILEKIVGKAMATTGTMGAAALLPDEKAARYVRKMQNRTVVLPEARYLPMNALNRDIDRVFFTGKILKPPPAEGQPVQEADFSGISTDQTKLTAVKAISVVPLTDEVLEENIEREAYQNTLLDLIAERVGIDVEQWGIAGDTGSSDPLLALNDGWLKLAGRRVQEDGFGEQQGTFVADGTTSEGQVDCSAAVPMNRYSTTGYWQLATGDYPGGGGDTIVARDNGDGTIVDVGATGIGGTIDYNSGDVTLTGLVDTTTYYWAQTSKQFDASATDFPSNAFALLLEAVPKPYLRNRADWRFYCPFDIEDAYRNELILRDTVLGDTAQTGDGTLRYKGIPVVYVPEMTEGKIWMTNPDNTVYGVMRAITMETEREAKAQRTDFINSLRVDFNYEEPEAALVADVNA